MYKVKRLMFGVKVAPNCWQRYMDQLLANMPGVTCFFDDIMVQGATYEETLQRLEMVFEKLKSKKLHLNYNKCKFFQRSINYLGHVIDADGLHTSPENVDIILKTKPPTDLKSLRDAVLTELH